MKSPERSGEKDFQTFALPARFQNVRLPIVFVMILENGTMRVKSLEGGPLELRGQPSRGVFCSRQQLKGQQMDDESFLRALRARVTPQMWPRVKE